MLYRRKFGPFNPVLRMDAAIARLYVSQYDGRPPNPRKMENIMPWPREDEVAQPASIDQVFAFLSATVKKKPH